MRQQFLEFALNHLVASGAVPLEAFDTVYRDHETGAPAVGRYAAYPR